MCVYGGGGGGGGWGGGGGEGGAHVCVRIYSKSCTLHQNLNLLVHVFKINRMYTCSVRACVRACVCCNSCTLNLCLNLFVLLCVGVGV